GHPRRPRAHPGALEARVSAGDLTELLQDRDRRDQIVARFVSEVRQRALLFDRIPRFLDEIVDEIARLKKTGVGREEVGASYTAREHGEHRWVAGDDLEALIREYGVLHHCILRAAADAGVTPTVEELDALARCLHVGVAEAATEYVRYR